VDGGDEVCLEGTSGQRQHVRGLLLDLPRSASGVPEVDHRRPVSFPVALV
jgi:hypothetical protein